MSTQNFKIYKGQGLLRFEFDTGNTDISGGTAVIKYIKPGGTTGQWVGVIDGSVIKYQLTDNTTLDESGDWKFIPEVTVSGLLGICDEVIVPVLEPAL